MKSIDLNMMRQLRETIIAVHGQTGRVWWDNLPLLLKHLSKEQGLTLLPPFKGLSYNMFYQ